MPKKTKVGVLFGGKSAEHEVSVASAKNVIEALDKDKYAITLIGIDKQGKWFLQESAQSLLESSNPKMLRVNNNSDNVALLPGDNQQLINLKLNKSITSLDVIFPVLHGPLGEDGTVQGLFRLADIPFVGADVLACAASMDKDVTKRLLRDAGIQSVRFMSVSKHKLKCINLKSIVNTLGLPCFVKPAHLGSSVAISKVKTLAELQPALELALEYDTKVLIEEFIEGREIECSVLGNDNPIAALPGEVITHQEFYSYAAKYLDEDGASLSVPADIPVATRHTIQQLAVRAFMALELQGMARVDFFLRNDGSIYLNEVNPIPGFTNISMYPKLWEASGLAYPQLIDRLIDLALERHANERRLKIDSGNLSNSE